MLVELEDVLDVPVLDLLVLEPELDLGPKLGVNVPEPDPLPIVLPLVVMPVVDPEVVLPLVVPGEVVKGVSLVPVDGVNVPGVTRDVELSSLG